MSKFVTEIAGNVNQVCEILEKYQPEYWQIIPLEQSFYRIFMQITPPSKDIAE